MNPIVSFADGEILEDENKMIILQDMQANGMSLKAEAVQDVAKQDTEDTKTIPKLNWKSYSQLYMMGIGWILLTVILLFQRKKEKNTE